MPIPTCTLTGTIEAADGSPLPDTAVRVRVVDRGNNATFIGGVGVSTLPLATKTDQNGQFSLNVARNVTAVVLIDELDYEKQVTIPDQVSVDIKDL